MTGKYVRALLPLGLGLAIVASVAVGQTPYRPPVQDPTQPSSKLRSLLTTVQPKEKKGGVVLPKEPRLPALIVKGRAVSQRGESMAILSVDGKVYFVSKGSMVSSDGAMLKVTDVTDALVKVEVQPNNVTLTLR